ncbi:hypothetical protein SAMN05216228_100223 [Rhizobium tibeticum]|uniref:Uncharacterized protein n=1 Tax=Rhizobium tibeticum TaxID=501024 RepID=A0A1H8DF85_9HYPH|nr:hypothetical protein [Rhizobium tibeticum]SEH51448.1 hypothetical protein RTCCBAU85039_0844 [Rhizobium tibeticum]SEN05484.1 hypothetical protein SAMN05216228_100223 [Rhizobium tibeticum]
MKKTLLIAAGLAAVCMLAAFVVVGLPADAGHVVASLMPHDVVGTMAMTTLAASKTRDYQLGDKEEYPVIASDIIYQGAAVGENGAGYARPLVAADPFIGFAMETIDNSGGAAGAKGVNLRKKGNIVLPIAGLAITANDRPAVYASDDDTFTLTAAGNSLIGYVSRWVSTGVGVVEFDAALARAALQA